MRTHRPTRTRLAAVLALLLAVLLAMLSPVACALPAAAQSTGGSFGGGDFSSGGGSSGGSSGGAGGGYSGGGGSSYSSGGSGTNPGIGGAFCLCVMVLGFLAVAMFVERLRKRGKGAGAEGMFLSQVTLGIDWRARKALQEQLARLAASGQTGTKEGRATLLRETALALRRAELAWLYAAFRDGESPMSGPQAQSAFQAAASEARARFREEIVRNADGTLVQNPTPELRASATEGQGTVVVSLITVARRRLTPVTNLGDAGQLRAALQDRGALDASSLVALEVVWSPAAENDRMSTAELEQNYPELRLIDPRSIAGRLFCAYCNGPFAMELLNCPHCGAPAPKVEQGQAQGPGPAPLGPR